MSYFCYSTALLHLLMAKAWEELHLQFRCGELTDVSTRSLPKPSA